MQVAHEHLTKGQQMVLTAALVRMGFATAQAEWFARESAKAPVDTRLVMRERGKARV